MLGKTIDKIKIIIYYICININHRRKEKTMSTNAQIRASKRYNQKNTKAYAIVLNKRYDQDLIKWMEAQPNKQGAIKELIRKAIESGR